MTNNLTKTNNETNISVIDSIMGSGKTSWAIQHMNEADSDSNFIYITPLLSEVKRVKDGVKNRIFIAPEHMGKGKMDNLKKLVLNERNIVSTHALFQNADEELLELIKAGNYTLILDEAMHVVDKFPLDKDDFKLLVDNHMVTVDEETGMVLWNDESAYQHTKYNQVKNLSKTENLYFFENTILFWTFPVSAFSSFKEIFIMTYLFQAQQQKYYYDMYNVNYQLKAVQVLPNGKYGLLNHGNKQPYNKEALKALINIYDGKLNSIGEDQYAFSVTWFSKETNKQLIAKMKKNLHTYFRRHARTSTTANMWTCYKDYRPQLKGNGYGGTEKKPCFIAHNARATNDFQHKESLAYVVNKFMNPYEKKFFQKQGVVVDEDMFALSELIQWIWRSRIRTGKPINLYIPSKRMRTILQEYLDSDL